MRVLISSDPFSTTPAGLPWNGRGQWPGNWVRISPAPEVPLVAAFRVRFSAESAETVRVHVTADERYELYLDGEFVGRGSERGDPDHWFFESYDLQISEGSHVLVARVVALGEKSAFAQHSTEPGFLLVPHEEGWRSLIGTGKANWEGKLLPGYERLDPITAWGTGFNVQVNGDQMLTDWKQGAGEGWTPVETRLAGMNSSANDQNPLHVLMPATLPPMREEAWTRAKVVNVSTPPDGPTNVVPILAATHQPELAGPWQALLEGTGALTVPAHSRQRVLIDLQDYVCGYPRAVLSGGLGARVRVHWQESLYEAVERTEKGNRDEIEGKFFTTVWHRKEGVGDQFVSGGQDRAEFDTFWWQAGRYVEILVETKDAPLTLESFVIAETHYPYEFESTFDASDPRLLEIIPIMKRVLEMCSHETYMDCPYYEQLQYIGDTRLQVLLTYMLTSDDRLPRKALRMFEASMQPSGLTQSRYPCRVLQVIPTFSLWWVCMLNDFARYRGDLDFVRALMPGARRVIDAYINLLRSDGHLGPADGWNFIDWVPTWDGGMAKDANTGISGIISLQFVLTLRLAAELEEWLGEPELAVRDRRYADAVAKKVNEDFWSAERGLYANDLAHTEFSEHAQCLALLSHSVPEDRKPPVIEHLLSDADLDRATIYFAHYLFETYTQIGRTDRILDRMGLWFGHIQNGLKTTIESPEPTRSDCHAWGAHPLFHYYASFLGVRPTAPGFAAAQIQPQLGGLAWARGAFPTPLGTLSVDAGAEETVIVVPEGMKATYIAPDGTKDLQPGANRI